MSSLVGVWFRIDPFSGRFVPICSASGNAAAASSPGNATVCVTSPTDSEQMIWQALNAAAVVPMPLGGGRWTVVWATLKAAWQGSTTTPLVPTTA